MPKINSPHTDQYWVRVDSVINLILSNDRFLQSRRNKELTNTVKEKFNISTRMAQQLISDARKEVKTLGRKNSKKALEKAIRDRELLFSKVKGNLNDNFKAVSIALEVLQDRDKLLGLYSEVIKSESTVKNIDLSNLTEYGLERLKNGDKIEEVLMDEKSVKQK